jgi:hypothetical protein
LGRSSIHHRHASTPRPISGLCFVSSVGDGHDGDRFYDRVSSGISWIDVITGPVHTNYATSTGGLTGIHSKLLSLNGGKMPLPHFLRGLQSEERPEEPAVP